MAHVKEVTWSVIPFCIVSPRAVVFSVIGNSYRRPMIIADVDFIC